LWCPGLEVELLAINDLTTSADLVVGSAVLAVNDRALVRELRGEFWTESVWESRRLETLPCVEVELLAIDNEALSADLVVELTVLAVRYLALVR